MEDKRDCHECGGCNNEPLDVSEAMYHVLGCCQDIDWTAPPRDESTDMERSSAAVLLAMGELACLWLGWNEDQETVQ